jgi:C4-dicarboxylate transporter DctM subunit
MVFAVIGLLLLLLLSGMPVAFCLGIAAVAGIYFCLGTFEPVPHIMWASLDNFTLTALPFFILAAGIMVAGNVTRHLVNAVYSFFGHMRAGPIVVGILSCALFSAISGSSVATAMAVGAIVVPALIARGYGPRISAGSVAAAGSLGILIPPSLMMIVYGSMAEVSVARLFLAGIVPGVVLALLLVAVSVYCVRGKRPSVDTPSTWAERGSSLKRAFWGLLMPVILMVLIYGGICTPTEAAVMAAVYTFIISLVFYRGFKVKDIPRVLAEGAGNSSMIMIIVASAMLLGYYFTLDGLPTRLVSAVVDLQLPWWGFLLAVNAVLLLLGCMLEVASICLVALPLLLPVLEHYDIDLVHFCIIMVINMELAVVTPPVGMNLFAISGVSRLPVTEVFRGALPYVLVILGFLLFVTFYPPFSLIFAGP